MDRCDLIKEISKTYGVSIGFAKSLEEMMMIKVNEDHKIYLADLNDQIDFRRKMLNSIYVEDDSDLSRSIMTSITRLQNEIEYCKHRSNVNAADSEKEWYDDIR